MKRVNLTRELTINVTGFDRTPRAFALGEQDVPDAVAAWLSRNAAYGEVLSEPAGESTPAAPAGSLDRPQPLPEPSNTEPEAAGDDLDALTVAELRERMEEAGIGGTSGMRKAELIAALRAAEAEGDAEA